MFSLSDSVALFGLRATSENGWGADYVKSSFCSFAIVTVKLTPSRLVGGGLESMMAKPLDKARMERAALQVAMAKQHPEALLGPDAMQLLTGDSIPTIYRHASEGKIPRPVSRGRWHGGSVLAALAKKSAGALA